MTEALRTEGLPSGSITRRALLAAAGALAVPRLSEAASSRGADWPQWRGSGGAGVADGQAPPVRWSKTGGIAWSARLPGWGTSSPVVYRDRVFVTSQAEQNGRKSLLTLCFNRSDGRELWHHDFGFGSDQHTHEKSNLAANTPVVTADALYVSFANAEFARYTHDGRLVWVTRLVPQFGDPKTSWGWGASPVLLPDSVLFAWDHHAGPCYLLGMDRETGKIAWKVDRPIGTSHSTPVVVAHHGQTDLLVPGKHRLTAFDSATHRQLWVYGEGEGPFNGEIIVSPVYGDGIVFTQIWRRSPIHALQLQGGGAPPKPLWVSEKPGPQESSLLYYRGLLYVLLDNGVLVCYEGKTGRELYRERLGMGDCNASPVAADGRVYASNNAGQTIVVEAGPRFRVLAVNDLGERITASPALSNGQLITRTDSTLWCIGPKR
jgi:outer membrane protein assembly factor BamB